MTIKILEDVKTEDQRYTTEKVYADLKEYTVVHREDGRVGYVEIATKYYTGVIISAETCQTENSTHEVKGIFVMENGKTIERLK